MPIKMHKSIAIHPGIWLRSELLGALGLSIAEAAQVLQISEHELNQFISGKSPINLELAKRFETEFSVPAILLTNMQSAHDEASKY